ncbi:hypothetical protein BDV39DRAFT_192219 [Aspergillus sergii]|uniref:Uncharacterized protein n=1 Tax=Aspergillus sergii TaxID=1034303 RepID=A0A5N6X541_9EURO|nr:hypothetical protein BDV39DRAFT_192219 [Aspergillus sergii]
MGPQDVQANCHPLHSASPHQEDQTVPRACLLPQEQRVSPSHPPSPQPQVPQAVSHPSPTCPQETSPSPHHQAASPPTSKSQPPALPASPQCPVPSLANPVSAPVLPPVSPVPRAKRAGTRPRLVQAQRVSLDRHRDWASLVDLFRGWMGMSNYWGFMLGVYAANLNYTLLCCFLYFVFTVEFWVGQCPASQCTGMTTDSVSSNNSQFKYHTSTDVGTSIMISFHT